MSSSLPLRTAMSSLRAYETASDCSADISPDAANAPPPPDELEVVDEVAAADGTPKTDEALLNRPLLPWLPPL